MASVLSPLEGSRKKIYNNIGELVGNTPLVRLNKIVSNATIVAKVEYFNPGLSVKDRVAFAMIEDAEQRGIIKPGVTTIIEPTSGNTGIGLALAGVVKGYKVITVMSEAMSVERRTTLAILSAQVVLTPAANGIDGAVAKAKELAQSIENSFIPQQFENPNNPHIHELTTGPEIWLDTSGQVDVVVAGAGSGGTITGVSRFLKSRNPSIKIIAVEPGESRVLAGGARGQHNIQGIGVSFIPPVLDLSVVDEIFPVSTEEAIQMTRRMAGEEGIVCGPSSGAAVHAALEISKRPEFFGKLICVILPDHGLRYLSHPVFNGFGVDEEKKMISS